MRFVFDIEGNGLLDTVDTVWCIAAIDVDTKEKYSWYPNEIEEALDLLGRADELIGHNIITYDLPALEKVHGFKYEGEITDTLVLSRLAYPDRPNGHSLEAWGKYLGKHKGDFHEFHQFSQEMLDYCMNDVEVNALIYEELEKELEGFSSESRKIEHLVARIIHEQEQNGVLFDMDKAKWSIKHLEEEMDRLANNIRSILDHEYEIIGNKDGLKRIFKKSGGYHKNVQEWVDKTGYEVSGPFVRIEWQEADIGSRQKLTKQLLRKGWKPKHYTPLTDKGGGNNPKLTIKDGMETVPCPSLEDTLGDLGKDVALYYVYKHRKSQIEGWIDSVRDDGRITAGANPNATPTARMAHKVVANVPRPSSTFGHEMRSLFMVPQGYKMVGVDLSGVELRCLAHYMNDPEYTHQILEGDIHTYNQQAAGLPTRDNAKTFK